MSDTVARHRTAVDAFSDRVQAADGRWDEQTPCEGWMARDIVDHVTGNHRMLAEQLGGELPDTTGDPAGDWTAVRDAAMATLEEADLSQSIEGPMGPMPGEVVCGIMTNDILVHTWDLARAVGADDTLPPALVEGAYSALLPLDDMLRRPGFFGPKVEVPDSASTQERLLAFLGRQP